MISFVSPVYRAELILDKLVIEIDKVMDDIGQPYEIVLVDDRSPDNSWKVMKALSIEKKYVKSIRLSKNFGQHPAIMAGLSHAKGEWIVVLDCDMQDKPKEVVKLYEKAKQGYDIVLAKREKRKDPFLKKLFSNFFSMVYVYLTDADFNSSIANFGIYRRQVIKDVLNMNDYIKSFPLFMNWVGYRSTAVNVEHGQRDSGKTTYTHAKLISLAFNTIISFSNKPLKIFVKFGIFTSVLAFIMGLYTIYKYLNGDITVLGYSSLIVSIWFLSGVIITIIGVVGIYIGKIFDQTKNRPPFIIDKIINNEI
ncbi:glycosyltransferase family 2 protein [Hyunsoonleella pacifica]|uniref:Glycosyltransferase n=1 Tax=Hyunsoonleella pacifica TaxID=1080224 RepID=A0A4Q9FRI9_9FLAO|nr:glycosyltransferase family 2 protein [Hyunsoonleella pacifica]TBN18517.1 glycosyltransferase [Hyunsoonleella pacifica]GGD02453.1 glycosyl transferase family 2 [Hyunsoonleella pacifica]